MQIFIPENNNENDDHDDHQPKDLEPFFEDQTNLYASGVGLAIIVLSIIGALILYKLKKNKKIVKSLFRQIEDEDNEDN